MVARTSQSTAPITCREQPHSHQGHISPPAEASIKMGHTNKSRYLQAPRAHQGVHGPHQEQGGVQHLREHGQLQQKGTWMHQPISVGTLIRTTQQPPALYKGFTNNP